MKNEIPYLNGIIALWVGHLACSNDVGSALTLFFHAICPVPADQ